MRLLKDIFEALIFMASLTAVFGLLTIVEAMMQ